MWMNGQVLFVRAAENRPAAGAYAVDPKVPQIGLVPRASRAFPL